MYIWAFGALSSVGLERLPYKQEVAGSNPAEPTKQFLYLFPMAVTRLKRKKLKIKIASRRRKTVLKYLTSKPVLKKEPAKEEKAS